MFTLEGGLGDHSFLSSLNLTQKPTQIHTWYLSANLEGWFKLHGIARLLRSTGISFWFYHIFTIQLKISSESRFQFLESVPDTFTSSDSPISFCEVTFMLVREPFQTQYHLLIIMLCPGNVTPSFYHYQHIATAQGLKSKPFHQVSAVSLARLLRRRKKPFS